MFPHVPLSILSSDSFHLCIPFRVRGHVSHMRKRIGKIISLCYPSRDILHCDCVWSDALVYRRFGGQCCFHLQVEDSSRILVGYDTAYRCGRMSTLRRTMLLPSSVSCWLWHRVVMWQDTDVSEDSGASVFRFLWIIKPRRDMVGYQRFGQQCCFHLQVEDSSRVFVGYDTAY
jgi:hypothetical protein